MIILGKDKLDKLSTHNIVYQINCNNCPATYIGTSKRFLKKRKDEHIRDVKNVNERSALVQHIAEWHNHTFDFDNIRILDVENNKIKREFSEMLNIYLHPNTINRMEDINNLKQNYKLSTDMLNSHVICPVQRH